VSSNESVSDISLTVLGARGSIPVSGAEFLTYGGSTTCFALLNGSSVRGIVDAGTGLVSFRSRGLTLDGSIPVFLTHYHWDHIQGISMLGEVWAGACLFTFYGMDDPEATITDAIKPPWFPVSLADAPEPVAFKSLSGPVMAGQISVSSFAVNHPQGAVGYRLDGPSRSAAIVTDHESTVDSDDLIAKAIDGVDVLIHDAQYLPEEVASHVGWGHSSWENAVAMARRVGASELVLTSHEPTRTDEDVAAMLEDVRHEFAETTAAKPGLKISL
jgi:phosphoribosyl 1,2-cyclic phosphodiesterase